MADSFGSVGQGTTLALSVDTTLARVRTVQMPAWITEAVDFSALEDLTWMKFLAGGLIDPGEFSAELFFNSTIAVPTVRLVQVATFTFPIQIAGNTTNGILTGSGFVIESGFPNAGIAEPMMAPLSFKFDGIGTVPSFSLESA